MHVGAVAYSGDQFGSGGSGLLYSVLCLEGDSSIAQCTRTELPMGCGAHTVAGVGCLGETVTNSVVVCYYTPVGTRR